MLSENTKKQIQDEAERYVKPIGFKSFHPVIKEAVIHGCTLYAEQLEEVRKKLAEIKRLKESAKNTEELFPLLQYISNNL